jgi:hypothetical protein
MCLRNVGLSLKYAEHTVDKTSETAVDFLDRSCEAHSILIETRSFDLLK